jgi:hypothetical protein
MVIGVEQEREQGLFFFAMKGQESEQVEVLDSRGKCVGKVFYDCRVRTVLKQRYRKAELEGIME